MLALCLVAINMGNSEALALMKINAHAVCFKWVIILKNDINYVVAGC